MLRLNNKPKNQMKHLFLIAALLFAAPVLFAQTLKGILKDAATGETLPYVNIGVVSKDIGTVSNDNGRFTLVVPQGHEKNVVRFSMIGYGTLNFTVEELAQRLASNDELKMKVEATELKEVVVTNMKRGEKLLGNKTESQSVTAAFTSNKLGNEVGMIMRVKGKVNQLKTFTASIASDNNPDVKMRLNFYSVKNGLPDKPLVNQNIIVATPRSSGKLVVDLMPYDIMVEEDFFVTLEWIEDAPDSKRIWFSAALLATPLVARQTSQGDWQKLKMAGIGFTIDTIWWK